MSDPLRPSKVVSHPNACFIDDNTPVLIFPWFHIQTLVSSMTTIKCSTFGHVFRIQTLVLSMSTTLFPITKAEMNAVSHPDDCSINDNNDDKNWPTVIHPVSHPNACFIDDNGHVFHH